MSKSKSRAADKASVTVQTSRSENDRVVPKGRVRIRGYGPTGNLKFEEVRPNIVVNQGLNYVRDVALLGGTQISTWYLGLTATSPSFAAGDTATAGGHPGWTEATGYSETTREVWTGATISVGTADNTATSAQYSINETAGFGGVFMTSASGKGSATNSQTLYSGVAFSQDRSLASGDTLTVDYTHSYSDDV